MSKRELERVGVLARVRSKQLLLVDTTRLLEGEDAVSFYRPLQTSSSEGRRREAKYWIKELQAAGVRLQ